VPTAWRRRTPAGVRVFRVAPHAFVDLYRGTWHAGPLWGEAPDLRLLQPPSFMTRTRSTTTRSSSTMRTPSSPVHKMRRWCVSCLASAEN
jgi:hypothetical protein